MGVLGIVENRIGHQRTAQKLIDCISKVGALCLGATTLLITQAAVAETIGATATGPLAIQPLLAQTNSTAQGQLTNGIYLFGEKPLPDQLQTAYMIFEARAGEVVGAFYSPHSSFDCFEGDVQNAQMSLAITETYSQEVYPYMLNLDDTAIAGPGGSQFAIEGFHQIDAVSDNDMRMLSTCQTQYSQTI
ncbi:hypothetical protein [Leptothoe kymatousa]|uniref:Uncharacterized protein n=1 Tax=Leptothoe kymatousa TAU-MAC 1615 TaxID=2364775 RepID=A0ABS5XYW3_9CYAN|nr:hypothetical protein [Leptothoe kymatousa]MBT9310804.1 hypothetical protein [Leptothoe kymatousa TAU-MAC 1615]